MFRHLFLALDRYESGQVALGFTAGLAGALGATVRVVHVREFPSGGRSLPLETPVEAQTLVDDAVVELRELGITAHGKVWAAAGNHLIPQLVDDALAWECDAIVLGSRRLLGLRRLSGNGVREHILRRCSLPVLVAPAPLVKDPRSHTRLPGRTSV